jgi:ubiquinone biosynthesis monooxygenase Coq7
MSDAMTDAFIDPPPAASRRVPPRPGPGTMAARLAQMLRVDHAGELGAVHIYRGQRAVLGAAPRHENLAAVLADMEAHEARHLERMEALVLERRIRPTLLAPLWRAAGFALGAGTALIGPRAAHACTEAVESVIEGHYADQIAEISELEPDLARELAVFREDELAHKREAVEGGALEGPVSRPLRAVIRAGCRAAIKISERL